MVDTNTAAYQPDYIAIAIVVALIAVVIVMVIRKHMSLKRAAQENNIEITPVSDASQQTETPKAPGSAGRIKLYDVEPKTAAMIMAIVADKMDKPLNELRFISIKEVK